MMSWCEALGALQVVDLEDQAAHVSSSGVLRLPASGSLRRVCASGDGRLLLQLRASWCEFSGVLYTVEAYTYTYMYGFRGKNTHIRIL